MPDFDKLDQIKKLAELLGSMPPQQGSSRRIPVGIEAKRIQWATELVNDFGVRVHPDLATKKLVSDGPMRMGNVTVSASMSPGRAVDKLSAESLLEILRGFPNVAGLAQLADEVEHAMGDPTRERQILDRIAAEFPDLIRTAKQMAENAAPEEFEQ